MSGMRKRSSVKEIVLNVVLVLGSLGVGLIFVEITLRMTYLENPLVSRNFTVDRVNQVVTKLHAIDADPVVGYVARPYYKSAPYNHGEYGIRLNSAPKTGKDTRIRSGGILVTGDSFVYGSEVYDHQSWPALLEKLTKMPVVNGAAGGYGFDMAYLRMEQLAPIIKPKAMIIGCIPGCVQRNELTLNAGLSKPHFQLEGNVLRLMPPTEYQPSVRHVGPVRKIFGRLFTFYWVAERTGFLDRWLVQRVEYQYTNARNGPEISCRLMKKFSTLAATYGAKPVLLVQYSGFEVLDENAGRHSWKIPYILGCARDHNITFVDSFDYLLAEYKSDPAKFWDNWVKQPNDRRGHSGHMSEKGNLLMAKLLAAVLPDLVQP